MKATTIRDELELSAEAQNRTLQTLIEREERLTVHLREVLAASRKERKSIEAEKNRLLSPAGHG